MSLRVKNALYTKNYNRMQLLRLLRQEPLSRATLSRLTGLTRAAISLITEDLIAEGIIRQSDLAVEGGSRGRTPVLLELCPDAYYAVGIRISRRGCRVGISDFSGRILAQDRLVHMPEGTPDQILSAAAKTAWQLIRDLSIPKERILGTGVAAPGPVDPVTGMILNPPGFDRWRQCPVGDILSRHMGMPVYLENDANAAALHNYMDYDFCGKENFLLLLVDSGVGSGVISGGKLQRSGEGQSCELGHTTIDFRGPVCSCGNRGCLEMYAATQKVLASYPGYDSWDGLMASKDAEAALRQEAEYLAAAIVNFTNLVRVETVLLAGDLQAQSQRIIPYLEQQIQGRSLALGETALHLAPALMGPDTYIQAACNIVFGHFLEVC